MVENYTYQSGLGDRKLSPHALRHTFATLLYGSNVGLLELQRLLGHDSLASTRFTPTLTRKDCARQSNAIR